MIMLLQSLLDFFWKRVPCRHKWRYTAVGDPSIGGTMVSRYFECSRCHAIDTENYYYDESCFRYQRHSLWS